MRAGGNILNPIAFFGDAFTAGGTASFSGSTVAVASLHGAGDVGLGATTFNVGAGSFSGVISGANASLVKVRSRARAAGSISKWLMMRCRSESCSCRIWCSQCTISTYGLPRSLQNTVLLSTAR